jgi:hypothetical protein
VSTELPASAFRLDPDLVEAFVDGTLDIGGRAQLADDVALLLPFHYQLPHPVTARLLELTRSIGGDEALMSWLDSHSGRPRVTAVLYRVIAFLDAYSARPGVVQALREVRAYDPYPHGLVGDLVPDSTDATLASLSQRIESLLADDQPEAAVRLGLRTLDLVADLALRAAELDSTMGDLPSLVEKLRRELSEVAASADGHSGEAGADREPR